jgi:hypothetical protein
MNKIKEAVRFCHLGSQKIKMSPRLFQLTTSKRLFRTKAAKELISQVTLGESVPKNKLEVQKQSTFHAKLNERIFKKKESIGKLALQIA